MISDSSKQYCNGKFNKNKGFPQKNYYLTNKNIYVIQRQWLYN